MIRTARVVPRALLSAVLLLATPPLAQPLSLSGRSAADRDSAQPLRELDLAAALDGAPAGGAAAAALDKLPSRCRERADRMRECDDDLRCAWLAARGAAATSWSAMNEPAREQAVSALVRVAGRLAAGGACGRTGEELARWEADRRQADIDAGQASLALAARVPDVDAGPILGGRADREVRNAIAGVRASGVSSVGTSELAGRRGAYLMYAQRQRWIASQPALAELRRVVVRAWTPVGAVPTGCGEDLLRGELLEDQWRGFLVREVAPAALDCLGRRLPAERARKGKPVSDPASAERYARDLAGAARSDAGGRQFGVGNETIEGMTRLAAALEPPAPRVPVVPDAAPSALAKEDRRGRKGKRTEVRPDAVPVLATSPTPVPSASRLATIARQVARYTGDDPSALSREARGLGTEAARDNFLKRLFVELHRGVCRPLVERDPEDVEAMRRVFGRRAPDERTCRSEANVEGLEALLDEADSLASLSAAADLRAASRAAAAGQFGEARRVLQRVPATRRGASWSVVAAWVARVSGDTAGAAQLLGAVDRAELERLRASGAEAERLVAQAAGAPGR